MAGELKEYVVTLHNMDELDAFYEDMETPGGNLYIPDRAVEVTARRSISRNTHYMLSVEEVETVKNDPRVLGVDPVELLAERSPSYKIENGTFSKSSANNSNRNWGMLACMEEANRSNWGSDGTGAASAEVLNIPASGKNVDVVIIDGHMKPDHPEYAVNPDGTGGSRVIQYNWFQHAAELGLTAPAEYIYEGIDTWASTDNSHGAHVAGTAAGNRVGWARDANIYNISPYSSNPNSSAGYAYVYDYVRAFHANKPINEETGRKNPTIVNMSYGTWRRLNYNTYGAITAVTYRGTRYAPGRALTAAELAARGVPTDGTSTSPNIDYIIASEVADIQSMIDDGIICVGAAGNNSLRIVDPSSPDYNNTYEWPISGTTYSGYLNRGGGVSSTAIAVGSISTLVSEEKAYYSNCGSQVAVFAPGTGIMSAVNDTNVYGVGIHDPRSSSYWIANLQGTSMASPQVTGVLACLLEIYPNMSHADALQWLTTHATVDRMYDTDTLDASDLQSLQGAPNRYLKFYRERRETGNTFPKVNYMIRPSTGVTYPRVRIRRKG